MKRGSLSWKRGIFIDIGYTSLKVLRGGRGLVIPLERSGAGELTEASREKVSRALGGFLGGFLGRFPGRRLAGSRRALCGVPARGVTVRRITLPAVALEKPEEMERVLALQLEREFPLPVERLGWGYSAHPPGEKAGKPRGQAIALAALRREVLDEYAELLRKCDLEPIFSVGALASLQLFPAPAARAALLDMGKVHSELLLIDGGVPSSLRTIPWGGDSMTQRISERLGIPAAEAEDLKLRWKGSWPEDGKDEEFSRSEQVYAALKESIQELAGLLWEAWAGGAGGNGSGPPPRLFLAGGGSRLQGLKEMLEPALGGAARCEVLGVGGGTDLPGASSVNLALRREGLSGREASSLRLASRPRTEEAAGEARAPRLALWLGAALFLAAAALGLRYLALLWQLPELERSLAVTAGLRKSLPGSDDELRFLENLAASQAPFLDAMAAVAAAAPRGTLLEGLSMNRQGEVNFQGTLSGLRAANEFRGKLAVSGLFSQVVLEEQSPIKDEKMAFRMRARLAVPRAQEGR